jgi:hypothetical protein
MQISGVGHQTLQAYQAMKTQQNQAQAAQSSKVNPSTQPVNNDPDHDGDVDGLGKDIDVRA